MKASDELLGTVFSKGHRYEIPIFQRPYVWDEENNWLPLLGELTKAAEEAERDGGDPDGDPKEHFLGALVTQARAPLPRRVPTSFVIDGQQRMTTLQVALSAARRVAVRLGAEAAAGGFSTLTVNRAPDPNRPEDRHKITPLREDREAFYWATREPDSQLAPPDNEHRLARASKFFEDAFHEWAHEADDPQARLDYLHFAVENRFKVVSVFLDSKDDPQVIFEALNHLGVRLDAADLVKNLLFQEVDRQSGARAAEDVHEQHWRVLDGKRWRHMITTGRIKRARVDALLAYWLSAQRGEESSVDHLFNDFKEWLKGTNRPAAEIVADIRLYADTMDALFVESLDTPVGQLVDRLEATRTTTVWPLLLFLFSNDAISDDQRNLGVLALDSFLMRRAMCRMDSKDYNKLFGSILGRLAGDDLARAGDLIVEELSEQSATSRVWPRDTEFRDALLRDDLYNTLYRARLKTFLIGLENQLLSAKTDGDPPRSAQLTTLSIEHVMPQHWERNWGLGDGATESQIDERNRRVHRLGNLTILTKSLNSSMSNEAWTAKRASLRTHSLVRLTTGSILSPLPGTDHHWEQWESSWTEDKIDARGEYLADLAIKAWPGAMTRTPAPAVGRDSAKADEETRTGAEEKPGG